ncbi:type II toxin-antitoxin system Phd/YefM family antitoxin [Mucilaginibacter angelicae]|uniref:Antitoxin n=1 Tax=Mucilaginibacter angelicae TaxID=869718 RepID=A0ABV6LA73_9SPHI
MKVLKIFSLRSKMKFYFDMVSNSHEVIMVSKDGNEDNGVVIISIQEYNSLTETDHLLSSNANNKRLSESINQFRLGKTIQYDFSAKND